MKNSSVATVIHAEHLSNTADSHMPGCSFSNRCRQNLMNSSWSTGLPVCQASCHKATVLSTVTKPSLLLQSGGVRMYQYFFYNVKTTLHSSRFPSVRLYITFMIFLFRILWEQITIWNQIVKLPTKVRKNDKTFIQPKLIFHIYWIWRKRNIPGWFPSLLPLPTPPHSIFMGDESHTSMGLRSPLESSWLTETISTNSSHSK